MKKIWIIVPSYEYEGYSEPFGAYTTERKALNARAKLYDAVNSNGRHEYSPSGNPSLDVLEVEIVA